MDNFFERFIFCASLTSGKIQKARAAARSTDGKGKPKLGTDFNLIQQKVEAAKKTVERDIYQRCLQSPLQAWIEKLGISTGFWVHIELHPDS